MELTREQAMDLLKKYNKEPFHIQHALTVEGVMAWYAQENGEDVAFCWRARQCGYKIWCDPSTECGHVAYNTVTRDFYRAFHSAK